jgi:isopenicillin N synthase-like dioxygenase
MDAKLTLHLNNSPAFAGYEPVGDQSLDSQDPDSEISPPDIKEGFFCGLDLPEDHPYVQRRMRRYGHIQWPSQLPEFREQTLAYQAAVRELGDRVLEILALSIGMPEHFFQPFYDMPSLTLGLLHYAPHPENAKFNQLGAGAHTDWGAITVLAQDDVGGLEVRNIAGEWIEATPVADTFVINLGDLMQRWTNGLYRSNMHRVRNKNAKVDRYSLPFFYGPRPDARIECLPSCVDAEHPAQFAACTAGEHNDEMFRRSHALKSAPEETTGA